MDLIRRINHLDRRWSLRWPMLGSIILSRAELIQRSIAWTTLVVIAVGVLASYWSRISPVIPIVAGILGIAGCALAGTYRSERRRYEEDRGNLYVRLIAIYFPED